MSVNIFTELQVGYEFMTNVERRIADIILADPQRVTELSMSELSCISDVSQGSINNFAKKFSSGGFAALKLKIAGSLATHESRPFSVIDSSQGLKSAMELKIEETLTAYKNTLEINDEQSLKAAAEFLRKAQRVEVYGMVHSGISARDCSYQLLRLGIPSAFVSDSLMFNVSAAMLDKQDVVVAVSSTGRTSEVLEAVKTAKENGASIICITSNKNAPIAREADVVLLTASSGMSISDRTDEIRSSQLLVIDTLCSYIRSLADTAQQKRYLNMMEILNSHSLEN